MQRRNLITTSQHFQTLKEPSSSLLVGPHICGPHLVDMLLSISIRLFQMYFKPIISKAGLLNLSQPLLTPYPELSTSISTVSSPKPWCLPWSRLVISSNRSASPISSSAKTEVSLTSSLSLLHHYLIRTVVTSCLQMQKQKTKKRTNDPRKRLTGALRCCFPPVHLYTTARARLQERKSDHFRTWFLIYLRVQFGIHVMAHKPLFWDMTVTLWSSRWLFPGSRAHQALSHPTSGILQLLVPLSGSLFPFFLWLLVWLVHQDSVKRHHTLNIIFILATSQSITTCLFPS